MSLPQDRPNAAGQPNVAAETAQLASRLLAAVRRRDLEAPPRLVRLLEAVRRSLG